MIDLSHLPLWEDVRADIVRRIRETGIGTYEEATAIAHEAATVILGDVERMAEYHTKQASQGSSS